MTIAVAAGSPEPIRVGLIDTGVNAWHSHVAGRVEGCRIYLSTSGAIREDGDLRDPVGHGTAVAGVLRQALPDATIFAVRVFDGELATYPSLVARGILRAAAAGCGVINLSLGVEQGVSATVLAEACEAAIAAGCTLVAAGRPGRSDLLPASLPGVIEVRADDALAPGEICSNECPATPWRAAGRPRDLAGLPPGANLWGHSFACARVAARLALTPMRGGTDAVHNHCLEPYQEATPCS